MEEYDDGLAGPHRPAYRRLAQELRRELESGSYADGDRLPTEVELRERFGVGRHTIREALKELTADGLIYRVAGSGTFVTGRPYGRGRYLRTIGSLDEIIVWPETDMEVIDSFRTEVDPAVAQRLQLDYVEVSRAIVRRKFKGVPFVLTNHYVSPILGDKLRENNIPSGGEGTVIAAAEPFLPRPVAGAQQDITAATVPAMTAEQIGCDPTDAILVIERIYYDNVGELIEYTMSYFNPRRYSYRMELRRGSS
jgi:GntR family transcriptional regulator